MTGIVAFGAYVPRHRLTGQEIARARSGSGGGRGSRCVAGYDEDALTMAVEAARRAWGHRAVDGVLFCTSTPPYAVKNNASALHAALGLPEEAFAYDLGGAYRSVVGALRAARPGTLLAASDLSVSLAGEGDELERGDGAAALVFGPKEAAVAEIVETTASTMELLDQWRDPAKPTASASEERFPAGGYLALLQRTLGRLKTPAVDHAVVCAASARTVRAAAKVLGEHGKVRQLTGVGHTGCADPLLRLVDALEQAEPGQTILLAVLADGCDLIVVRRTDRPLPPGTEPVSEQVSAGRGANYLDVLNWRGLLDRAAPRRPAPAVVSPPASARNAEWKFGLHASRCTECGAVSAPPQRVCVRCGVADLTEPVALAELGATIRTFSVDRLAYSPNPPVVAAIVDFDGGGRLEVELADADPGALAVGARVRMVLRRKHSSGGVHNYTWKATLQEAGNG